MGLLSTSDPVAYQAQQNPDALACIELATDRRWSYAALDADIMRAVAVLHDDGIVAGDRVAVIARNSVWQLVMQQALMRMGGIFVPLNWRLAQPEIEALIADCTPKRVFRDLDGFAAQVDAATAAERRPAPHDDETCVILYTSGTSGRPKGAMLSRTFLMAAGHNTTSLVEVDSDAVFLCDMPMFHVMGLVVQICATLQQGGTLAVSQGFDAALTNARLCDMQLGVTHYFCAPQMADMLRHTPGFAVEKLHPKSLLTGGAPNPPAHIRWWLDRGILMADGYGMTECGHAMGMPLSADILRAKAGAAGRPGPVMQMRLVDAAGADVPSGAPGEMIVRGPGVIRSYWNRNDDALMPDGWFRTGDIGCADADGYVTVVDRRKDMFITGGENVFSVEVEAVLASHPAIREVAVIGIPDDRWGEVGRAFVVLMPGQSATAADLTAHCDGKIGRFKIPKEFVMVASLPRTASGKVMKHVLRAEGVLELAG